MAARRARVEGGRAIIELPRTVPPVTGVRTTLLSASLLAIRERGLFETYLRELPREHHEFVHGLVAGAWVPIELGMVHYAALDRIGLTHTDQYEIGVAVGTRLQHSVVGTAMRLVGDAGATPWTALKQVPRLWSRVLDGGAVSVYELGPKDARIEFHRVPLARFAYCRNGWRGMVAGVLTLICRKIFVTEVPEMSDQNRFVMHAAWV
jgi:hypothetical protein